MSDSWILCIGKKHGSLHYPNMPEGQHARSTVMIGFWIGFGLALGVGHRLGLDQSRLYGFY